MKQWFNDILKDESGRYSLSKFLHLTIGLSGIAISWKLVIFKEYSAEYFIVLLSYGMGQQTLNKFLDNRSPRREDGDATPRPPNNV